MAHFLFTCLTLPLFPKWGCFTSHGYFTFCSNEVFTYLINMGQIVPILWQPHNLYLQLKASIMVTHYSCCALGQKVAVSVVSCYDVKQLSQMGSSSSSCSSSEWTSATVSLYNQFEFSFSSFFMCLTIITTQNMLFLVYCFLAYSYPFASSNDRVSLKLALASNIILLPQMLLPSRLLFYCWVPSIRALTLKVV